MKSLYLPLCLAKLRGRREALADGLSIDLASQTKVRPMAGLVGLMTVTVWLPAATFDRGNGATPEITQLQDTRQDA